MVLRVTSSPGCSYSDIVNSYTWDAAGRMVTEEDGAGSVWTYVYNAQGLLASAYDPLYLTNGGYATHLTYDLEGRMTDKRVATDPPSPEVTSFVTLAYNAFGEVSEKTYSVPDQEDPASETYTYQAHSGRLTSVTGSNGITLTYGNFDCASRPRTLTYQIPGIGAKTEYVTYHANGSLASLQLPGKDPVSYTYNSEKHLSQVASGPDTYTYDYDNRGLAQNVSYPTDSQNTSLSLALTWTLDGRPATLDLNSTEDGPPPVTTTLSSLDYAYNAYGRVASVRTFQQT